MIRALLLLVALLVSGLSALKWNAERLQAQGRSTGRLQLHGEVDLNSAQDGWYTTKVQAVCDTGNGTMLYIARLGNSTEQLKLHAIPNGCQKLQAER